MDVHKAAAWATIGNFGVGCVTLYLIWKNQQNPSPGVGLNMAMVLGLFFVIGMIVSAYLQVVAARINAKRPMESPTPVGAIQSGNDASKAKELPALPKIPGRVYVPSNV